jgi:flagellar hook-associated protein 2
MNGLGEKMVTSIATSLGIGSGIDTTALVDQLTQATRAPKDAALKKREETNAARISAIGNAASGIDTFASSLSTLISGGTLFTQPNSSDTAVLTATALPGSRIGGLSAQVEVVQLAQAQSLVSEHLTGIDATVGQGTLTLTTAAGNFDIVIGSSNDSLAGLAAAINAKNAGVTATIVKDSLGARLALKGATGETKAFTLTVGAGSDAALDRFAYDPNVSGGMDRAQQAQDAIVKLDGVQITRATNSISDLIPGVLINLKTAKPGSTIALGSTPPTAAIRQAVGDFVAAYNELKKILDEATAPATDTTDAGPLRGDSSIREMQRKLASLSSTVLSGAGGPSTLAEIGVRTERNGSLTLDTARLDTMLASDPDGVEALFNPSQRSDNPLVTLASSMGRTKPGTYVLTNLVAASGGQPASGTIAGVAGLSSGSVLLAAVSSAAKGLAVEPLANVASAKITVDLGLGNALQAIRDALLATGGPLKSAQKRLAAETTEIGQARTQLEARSTVYHDQLVRSFGAMDKQVTAFKATQSYLDQQIKLWTNDNG